MLPKESCAKNHLYFDILDSDFKKALVCILTSQWCFMLMYCMDVKHTCFFFFLLMIFNDTIKGWFHQCRLQTSWMEVFLLFLFFLLESFSLETKIRVKKILKISKYSVIHLTLVQCQPLNRGKMLLFPRPLVVNGNSACHYDHNKED